MGKWDGAGEIGTGWQSTETKRAVGGGTNMARGMYSISSAVGPATKSGSGVAMAVGTQVPTSRRDLGSGSLRNSGLSQMDY